MHEYVPSRHHYRLVLTTDLFGSDLLSLQRDVATLRQHLSEGLTAYRNAANSWPNCTWDGQHLSACVKTTRTSEKASSSVDLTKPYLPDGTKSPDDPANWEWTVYPADPKHPTEK